MENNNNNVLYTECIAAEVAEFGGNPLMSTLPLATFWEAVMGPGASEA